MFGGLNEKIAHFSSIGTANELAYVYFDKAVVIKKVWVINSAAVTYAAATLELEAKVINRGTDGLGTAVIATLGTDVNWAAHVAKISDITDTELGAGIIVSLQRAHTAGTPLGVLSGGITYVEGSL